jgi:TusA-related sulfurtransferase
MEGPAIAKRLDVKGFLCPVPVFRAKKAIRDVPVGELLEVLATDPMSKIDIAAWAIRDGHELVAMQEEDEGLRFLVKRVR